MRQSKPSLFSFISFLLYLGLSTLKSDSYFSRTPGDHVRVFTQSDVRTHNRALPSEQHLNTTVALHVQTAGIWRTPTAAGTPQNAKDEFKTVADAGFPRGEGANSKDGCKKLLFSQFFPKIS